RQNGLGIRGKGNNFVRELRFEKLQSIRNIIEVCARLLDETDDRSFVAMRVTGGRSHQLSQMELMWLSFVCLSLYAGICRSLFVGITGWNVELSWFHRTAFVEL